MIKKRVAEVVRILALLGIFIIVLVEIMLNTSKIEIENEKTECYNNCNFNSINLNSLSSIDIYKQKQYKALIVGAKEAKLKKELEANEVETATEAEEEVSKEETESSIYEATFYTAKCKGCTGVTSSGYNVTKTIFYKGLRVVAAPSDIKFYTKLKITLNDGTVIDAIVLDRGGNIKKNRLDILVSSKKEAYKLGRQKVKVEVVE